VDSYNSNVLIYNVLDLIFQLYDDIYKHINMCWSWVTCGLKKCPEADNCREISVNMKSNFAVFVVFSLLLVPPQSSLQILCCSFTCVYNFLNWYLWLVLTVVIHHLSVFSAVKLIEKYVLWIGWEFEQREKRPKRVLEGCDEGATYATSNWRPYWGFRSIRSREGWFYQRLRCKA